MQTTHSPDKTGHPGKTHEPSPQRRPERQAPGHEDQGKNRQPGKPGRSGEDKHRDVHTPPDRH